MIKDAPKKAVAEQPDQPVVVKKTIAKKAAPQVEKEADVVR